MDEKTLRSTLLEALYDVAPDLASKQLDDQASLQQDYELDSADFLNLLIRIHERFGVEVPVSAYRSFSTLGGAEDFLRSQLLKPAAP